MMATLRAAIRILRDVPRQVREARAAELRRDSLLRYLDDEEQQATWTCQLHRDAWRRPDGSFRWLVGSQVLPLAEWDAEDFHGYEAPR